MKETIEKDLNKIYCMLESNSKYLKQSNHNIIIEIHETFKEVEKLCSSAEYYLKQINKNLDINTETFDRYIEGIYSMLKTLIKEGCTIDDEVIQKICNNHNHNLKKEIKYLRRLLVFVGLGMIALLIKIFL